MENNTKLTYKVNLEAILRKRGITKYKLAKDTGITRKTIRELGKRDTRISTLVQISNYLKIGICELITIENSDK